MPSPLKNFHFKKVMTACGIRYSVFGIQYSVFGIRYSVNGNQNQEKTSSLHTREAGHLTSSNLPRRLTIPLAASSRPRR